MKKDVLIVAPFTQLPGEAGNGRFHYIAQKLDKEKLDVELVTTDFSHRKKAHRNVSTEALALADYHVTLIHEPGYKRNISVQRYFSHYIMGRNLREYLKDRKKPDVIYCAVPPPSIAKVVARYAKRNNIPFIIDIQDIWPDAYKMFFAKPIISDVLFYPVKRTADYVYAAADQIVAVSQTYADRALMINKKCDEAKVVFLGTELETFDEMAIEYAVDTSDKTELWLAYVGTLSHSYDIPCVIDALSILKTRNITNIKFVVIGDGPLRSRFEQYAADKDVWVEFTGRLDYGEMVGLLSACDIAVNPIMRGSGGSIINKHGDYAAAGLPVLNTQESPEYRALVDGWKMGLNCINGDSGDLANKLLLLYNDVALRENMGANARELAKAQFDRQKTYQSILDLIGRL